MIWLAQFALHGTQCRFMQRKLRFIFCDSVQNNKLGPGFQNSTLYYMAKPYILQRDDFVNMKVPEWLQNSMSAVWNSGIEVIYAKDPIGDTNCRNAYVHGGNAWYIFKYLPKLVNE